MKQIQRLRVNKSKHTIIFSLRIAISKRQSLMYRYRIIKSQTIKSDDISIKFYHKFQKFRQIILFYDFIDSFSSLHNISISDIEYRLRQIIGRIGGLDIIDQIVFPIDSIKLSLIESLYQCLFDRDGFFLLGR